MILKLGKQLYAIYIYAVLYMLYNSWKRMQGNMETYVEIYSHKLKWFISFSLFIAVTMYALKFFKWNVNSRYDFHLLL